MTDIAITFDQQINVLSFRTGLISGDIATTDSLYTAVLYSLFTDKRADPDDVIPDGTDDRRGHWADDFIDESGSEGSKLWLLDREKQTQAVLNDAEEYARDALQWMIADGHSTKIDVTATWQRIGWMTLAIVIWSDQEPLINFNVDLR